MSETEETAARPLWNQWNRLVGWSRDLAGRGHDIAVESDRWFVAALQGLDRGMTRARSEVSEAGRQVMVRSKAWLPGARHNAGPKERIRRAIIREAKRRGFQGEQLDQFSQNIALVVELVLSGAVSVEDIAFEHAGTEEPEPASAARAVPVQSVSETPLESDQSPRAR